MSIRLRSDGHFLPDSWPEAPESDRERVVIEWIGRKTLLAPTELLRQDPVPESRTAESGSALDEQLAARLLTVEGMGQTATERIVFSDPSQSITAVMAIDSGIVEEVGRRYGPSVRWTTPLLHTPSRRDATIRIERIGLLLYTKVYSDAQLLYAHVQEAPGKDDLLYELGMLDRRFPFGKFALSIPPQDRNSELRQILKHHFKFLSTVCE